MSAIQKCSGTLAMGSVHDAGSVQICNHIRVGNDYFQNVKIPGQLSTLLRDGKQCTIWLAPLDIPTPVFIKIKGYVIYAVEVDGTIHNATTQAQRGLRIMKWVFGLGQFFGAIPTMIIWPLSLALLINTLRIAMVELPIEEMRREPAPSSVTV